MSLGKASADPLSRGDLGPRLRGGDVCGEDALPATVIPAEAGTQCTLPQRFALH
jgi:hypothetical protein